MELQPRYGFRKRKNTDLLLAFEEFDIEIELSL